MSNMKKEVTRAIAQKFLKETKGFDLIELENYKDNVVFLAFPKGATAETNVGLPIYVLIDKVGKARYATDEETHDLMVRSGNEVNEEED